MPQTEAHLRRKQNTKQTQPTLSLPADIARTPPQISLSTVSWPYQAGLGFEFSCFESWGSCLGTLDQDPLQSPRGLVYSTESPISPAPGLHMNRKVSAHRERSFLREYCGVVLECPNETLLILRAETVEARCDLRRELDIGKLIIPKRRPKPLQSPQVNV